MLAAANAASNDWIALEPASVAQRGPGVQQMFVRMYFTCVAASAAARRKTATTCPTRVVKILRPRGLRTSSMTLSRTSCMALLWQPRALLWKLLFPHQYLPLCVPTWRLRSPRALRLRSAWHHGQTKDQGGRDQTFLTAAAAARGTTPCTCWCCVRRLGSSMTWLSSVRISAAGTAAASTMRTTLQDILILALPRTESVWTSVLSARSPATCVSKDSCENMQTQCSKSGASTYALGPI